MTAREFLLPRDDEDDDVVIYIERRRKPAVYAAPLATALWTTTSDWGWPAHGSTPVPAA